jgi:hypothetical protein
MMLVTKKRMVVVVVVVVVLTWAKAQLHARLPGLEVHSGDQLHDARPVDLHHQGMNQCTHPRVRGVREVALQGLFEDVELLEELKKVPHGTVAEGRGRGLECKGEHCYSQ